MFAFLCIMTEKWTTAGEWAPDPFRKRRLPMQIQLLQILKF